MWSRVLDIRLSALLSISGKQTENERGVNVGYQLKM
jgi:hypothetical protein